MPVELRIADWDALEAAFGFNDPDYRQFLDTDTGLVSRLCAGTSLEVASIQAFVRDPGRYVPIDPVSSCHQHHWMIRFAASVPDIELRRRLESVLRGRGAFRLFKDVLALHAVEWQRWQACRSALLRTRIVAWLERKQLRFAGPLPWEADHAMISALEGDPHERLREVAVSALASLPDHSLPAALEYLRYVTARYGVFSRSDSDGFGR